MAHKGQSSKLWILWEYEGNQPLQFSIKSIPHALSGLVLIIAVELRSAQHCFGEHGQEAQGLHEQRRVQEDVGDVGRHDREGQHTLHIVHEAAPPPEVAPVKV